MGSDRFQTYIEFLNGGNKDQLALPIGGYNPMAKSEVLEKVELLISLDAEEIIKDICLEVNKQMGPSSNIFKIGLNLVDDIGGAWSNKFQTSFENIFRFNGVYNYNFCAPHFWMSEEITKELIKERTIESIWRTVYWFENNNPLTLEEHINQEAFVSKKTNSSRRGHLISKDLEKLNEKFQKSKSSTDKDLIFNFFYGDEASKELSYPYFGIGKVTGFDLAKAFVC